MDSSSLVIQQIDDGKKIIERLRESQFEITAAFWLKESDRETWYLYLVSPVVDTRGIFAAYKQIHEVVQNLDAEGLWVGPFDIKVIATKTDLAQAVEELFQRYPDHPPTRYNGPRLGDVYIDGAYIYPRTVNVK